MVELKAKRCAAEPPLTVHSRRSRVFGHQVTQKPLPWTEENGASERARIDPALPPDRSDKLARLWRWLDAAIDSHVAEARMVA